MNIIKNTLMNKKKDYTKHENKFNISFKHKSLPYPYHHIHTE